MKFMFRYLKNYKTFIALIFCIKMIGTLTELAIPYILEYMIDEIAPTKEVRTALLWGSLMVLAAFCARALNVTANRNTVNVARRVTYEMRRDLFWNSLHLSGSQMDQYGLPSITSRMTSDSYNVQNFIRAVFAMGIRAPILFAGGILVTLLMDAGMAAVLCLIAPLVIVLVAFISRKGIPLFDRVQKLLDKVVCIMRENITGIMVVKALSKEEYEKQRFGEANGELTDMERKANIIMALPGPVMSLFLNIGLTLVVVVGAYRVNAGVTKPGVILAFLTYFNMILMGVMGLNRIFMMLSKARASADRIQEIVDAQEELAVIGLSEAAVTDSDAYIKFSHVSFQYGKSRETGKNTENTEKEKTDGFAENSRRNSLTDIDFELQKGESLGIIGATGCGKTTIVNLLMRFYDACEGAVFIDGQDVRSYDADELHRMFGVVFQNDVVFADTIAENIAFGREVSQEEIKTAAFDARGSEFIENYEDGYAHKAAVSGANFSGGQRQRILIARALAARPSILILDDSSSALDYKTDAALRKAIREHHKDSTTVIIAQRISSIMSLDHIMMLEEGKMIGYGTHEELLSSCPAYREIYEVQMGRKEIEHAADVICK